jgi:hypothetical protein
MFNTETASVSLFLDSVMSSIAIRLGSMSSCELQQSNVLDDFYIQNKVNIAMLKSFDFQINDCFYTGSSTNKLLIDAECILSKDRCLNIVRLHK